MTTRMRTARALPISLLALLAVSAAFAAAASAGTGTTTTTGPCDYFEGNGLVDCNSDGTDLPGTCFDGSLPSCDPLGGSGSYGGGDGGGGTGASDTDSFHICSGLVWIHNPYLGIVALEPHNCTGISVSQPKAQDALGRLGCTFRGEKDSAGEWIEVPDRQAFYRLQSLVDTFGFEVTQPKFGQCSRAGTCRFKSEFTWSSDNHVSVRKLSCSYRFTA
jgi:hypothetical protein